jgi:hypothetical protein
MLMGDLVRILRESGIDARHWHIRHMIAAGAVEPPQRDSTGRFQFTRDDYVRIRRWLEAARESGPPRRWPSASDRRHGEVSSRGTGNRTTMSGTTRALINEATDSVRRRKQS